MKHGLILIVQFLLSIIATAQISPGDLAEVHAHLEGISNCTKCHTLGDKVSNDKCLDCHDEINERLVAGKGYHASKQVKDKNCYICHNDHHGRNFEIIRFDPDTFNHHLTGYDLLGAHAKQDCRQCHKDEYISEKELKEKDFTYLGLGTECLTCHDDYHRESLSNDCAECHNYEAFRPAPGFDHDKTDFKLKGKHRNLECIECHEITREDGVEFQKFSGIKHGSCVECHDDVHEGKFGQNCSNCHTEESFHQVKEMEGFNHSRTDYPLEGKHKAVDCRACHKGSYRDPLAFEKCMDCHENYHGGELLMEEKNRDCKDCHTVQGFEDFTYSIEEHQQSDFRLEGAHLATPCFACHQPENEEEWIFASLGEDCVDCHEDVHKGILSEEYYPGNNCRNCHEVSRWGDINFDHDRTDFKLLGAHKEQTCRACHFTLSEGEVVQQFKDLEDDCLTCHDDEHFGQFDQENSCIHCHGFDDWTAEKFNHDSTAFPLEGAHKDVACSGCHKEVQNENVVYVQYKIKDYRCEACH